MGEGKSSGTSNGGTSSGTGEANSPGAVPAAAVRAALNRVLQSQEFRSSHRSQDFLKYVVERTLDGQGESLKERTIGIDVFGRPASYDPSDDATVRVKAGEVRKRLVLYYANEGQREDVKIDLPAGTYVPEFHRVDVVAAPSEIKAAPPEQPGSWLRPVLLILVLVLLAGGGLGLWLNLRTPRTTLDEFWAPVLKGSTPVLLSAAFVPVYGVDPKMAPERPTRFEDFVLLTDQFVGGGDLLGLVRITGMLDRMKRPYRVKIGSDVSFQDLRSAPAVLVGYSYTRWREISKQLRFFIDAEGRPRMVTDNGKPTAWALPDLPPDRRTNEDYAIVTRVFHPDTQTMLVEVAGITQYGTEAGADFITTPESLAEALRKAPSGWQNKNLQFVLHVKVIAGTPTSPAVVGTYFW